MFSSLTSFLFGSSTSCESDNNYNEFEKKEKENEYLTQDTQVQQADKNSENRKITKQQQARSHHGIKGKEIQPDSLEHKKINNNKKNKSKKERTLVKGGEGGGAGGGNSELSDDDFDLSENDWIFVDQEEVNSPKQLGSRAALKEVLNTNRSSTPILEVQELTTSKYLKTNNDSHQTSRNSNWQKRNRGNKSGNANTKFAPNKKCNEVTLKVLDDGGDITQPLYVVSDGNESSGHNISGASCSSNGSGAKLFTMVDSWYMTPPPCFTSNGPANMEISPFENLLIEHPSMSVYHSIRSSQKATENYVNLCDLEMMNETNEMQANQKNGRTTTAARHPKPKKNEYENSRLLQQKSLTTNSLQRDQNSQNTVEGKASGGPRIDRCTAAQLKMELFAWNSQKSQVNRNNQNLQRNVILRSNRVREIQSKSKRQRRADLQHCRLSSGVNNNRKCCY